MNFAKKISHILDENNPYLPLTWQELSSRILRILQIALQFLKS